VQTINFRVLLRIGVHRQLERIRKLPFENEELRTENERFGSIARIYSQTDFRRNQSTQSVDIFVRKGQTAVQRKYGSKRKVKK